MTDSATMTLRLRQETKDRLDALAKSTRRSRSFLAAEAIEAFLRANAWQVEQIGRAVEKADVGGPFVPHDEAMAYLEARARGEEPELPEGVVLKP